MLKRITIIGLLSFFSLNVYAKDKELDAYFKQMEERGRNSKDFKMLDNPPKRFYNDIKKQKENKVEPKQQLEAKHTNPKEELDAYFKQMEERGRNSKDFKMLDNPPKRFY